MVGAAMAALKADPRLGLQAAGVVLVLSLLYNLGGKQIPWLGSLLMASVRASHALFALLLLGSDHLRIALDHELHAPGMRPFLWYPLLLATYVFGLTLISELESRRGRTWELAIGFVILTLPVLFGMVVVLRAPWLDALLVGGGMRPIWGVLAVLIAFGAGLGLLWSVAMPWWQAIRSASRERVPPVVIAALGGFILLDVVLASGAHPLAGICILALYPIYRLMSRSIRMG